MCKKTSYTLVLEKLPIMCIQIAAEFFRAFKDGGSIFPLLPSKRMVCPSLVIAHKIKSSRASEFKEFWSVGADEDFTQSDSIGEPVSDKLFVTNITDGAPTSSIAT